jgi:TetR/AcrR family transcriptional regulator
MARPARVSPDRILAAAAAEFAERGYAGARVDRIARRARVNKAMLYYHFKSKQGLYRTLLGRTFARAADRLKAIEASDAGPVEKLDRAITAVAAFVREQAFFPSVMLREIAERGAHLDRATLAALARVPGTFGAIVEDGIARGVFRPVDPIAAYFTIVPPIVFYLAGAAIRKELAAKHRLGSAALAPEAFVKHVKEATYRALAADAAGAERQAPERGRP